MQTAAHHLQRHRIIAREPDQPGQVGAADKEVARMLQTDHFLMNEYPDNWPEIAYCIKAGAGWKCERCLHSNDVASGHVLTVHHLDGNKANCEDWNLAALCQRCHLTIQGRIKMDQMFF